MSQIYYTVENYLAPVVNKLSSQNLTHEHEIEELFKVTLSDLEKFPEFIQARDDKNTSYFEIVFKNLLQDKILELIIDESKDFVQEIGNILDFVYYCSQKDFTSKYFANQCLLKVSKLAPFNQLPKLLDYLISRINNLMAINAAQDFFAADLVKMTNNMLNKLEGDKFSDIRGKIIWFTNTIIDFTHGSGVNTVGGFNFTRRFPNDSINPQAPDFRKPYFEQAIKVLDEYLAKPKCILENDKHFQDFQDLVKRLFEEISRIENTSRLSKSQKNNYYEISKYKLIEIITILDYLKLLIDEKIKLPVLAKLTEKDLKAAKARFEAKEGWDTKLKDSCYSYLKIVGFKNVSFIKEAERREKFWSLMKAPKITKTRTFHFNSKQEIDAEKEFEQKYVAFLAASKNDPSQVKPNFQAISTELVNKKRQAVDTEVTAKKAKLTQLPEPDFSKFFKRESALEFSKYTQVGNEFSALKGLLSGFDAEKLSDYSRKVNDTKSSLTSLNKYSPFQDTALCWKLMRKLRAKNLKVCNERLDMGPGFSVDRMTGFIFSNSSKSSKPGTISPKEQQTPSVKEEVSSNNGTATPKEQASSSKLESATNSGATTPKEQLQSVTKSESVINGEEATPKEKE